MTLHTRLLALARDPEIPRWCKLAIVVGAFIVGPFDELVIYPAVVGYVWLRRRHVLERHGFTGTHVLAGLATLVAFAALAGVAVNVLAGMVP